MALVGIATLIAGVVLLVKAKMAWKHSSQPPPPETDHSEMVDKGMKRTTAAAEVHNDTQVTQTDECTKLYQELDLATMESGEYASIKF